MIEDQTNHRMSLEKDTIQEEQRQSSKGQNLGFILGFLGILATGFLAYTGHDTVAGIFGTTTIIGLTGVFVYGKKSQQRNLEDKN